MQKTRISHAVEDLLTNSRLIERYRRRSDKALAGYHLSASELAAIRQGDLRGLVGAGMAAEVASRRPLSKPLFASIIVRHGAKLALPALAAIVVAVWPAATVSAAPPEVRGKRIAARALMRVRAGVRNGRVGRGRALRRVGRAGARRARARLRALSRREDIGLKRALRRVAGGDGCEGEICEK